MTLKDSISGNSHTHNTLYGVGPVDHFGLEQTARDALKRALPRMLDWTRRPADALLSSEAAAPGYRDFYLLPGGRREWKWPRSNQCERISVWVSAHLRDPQNGWLELARRYADAILADPIRGLCQPEIGRAETAPARGMVWYWRDADCYMSNYTMRVPPAMLDLYEVTADLRYRTAAHRAGEALLRFTQPATGLPLEGWVLPGAQASTWVSGHKINSRIGYATYAYARLYKDTNDEKYAIALDRLAQALRDVQRDDGAIPEEIRVDRPEAYSDRIKNHFLAYILNGAAAAAVLVPECTKLRELSIGVADYLMDSVRRVGSIPYGSLDEEPSSEGSIWRTTSADASAGFLDLHKLTGNIAYASAAHQQLLHATLSAFDCPEDADLHGGIPSWLGPASSSPCCIGGYFHFFSLLGALKLSEWKLGSAPP